MELKESKEVIEENRLINPRIIFRPLCKVQEHRINENKIYKSGMGCVVEIRLKCTRCGKKLPVEPDFSNLETETIEVVNR